MRSSITLKNKVERDDKMKIAVVHGGTSKEQAVSTLNAGYVKKALIRKGYKTIDLLYDCDITVKLLKEKPDAVFLCVQGKGHGDGTLQGILDHMNLPYTGSGMQAASIINDKILCQKLFAMEGIRVPENFVWTQKEHESKEGRQIFEKMLRESKVFFPCVAKAPSQGGSFGIAYLKTMDDYHKLKSVFLWDDTILIERFIPGSFVTVGILEREEAVLTLPIMEGISLQSSEMITFDGQYEAHPADLNKETKELVEEAAIKAFKICKARDYARIDYIIDNITGKPYTLEINAVPGLKPKSLYPPAAMMAGIEYDELIDIIIKGALKRGRDRCSEM